MFKYLKGTTYTSSLAERWSGALEIKVLAKFSQNEHLK